MNKSVLVAALLAVAGCSSNGNFDPMHHEDKQFRVTLYNDAGTPIREWIAVGSVISEGNIPGGQYFTEKGTGKHIRITGTVVVEEL